MNDFNFTAAQLKQLEEVNFEALGLKKSFMLLFKLGFFTVGSFGFILKFTANEAMAFKFLRLLEQGNLKDAILLSPEITEHLGEQFRGFVSTDKEDMERAKAIELTDSDHKVIEKVIQAKLDNGEITKMAVAGERGELKDKMKGIKLKAYLAAKKQ